MTWRKGARDLVYTKRHRVVNEGNEHMMQIKSTLPTDKGEFSVIAENDFGKTAELLWVKILPPLEDE